MKFTIILFLVISFIHVTSLRAFTFTVGDAEPKKTVEILKQKRIYPIVEVITDWKLIVDCTALGVVKSSRNIEIWQKKNACEIFIKDFKKKPQFKTGIPCISTFLKLIAQKTAWQARLLVVNLQKQNRQSRQGKWLVMLNPKVLKNHFMFRKKSLVGQKSLTHYDVWIETSLRVLVVLPPFTARWRG